MLMAEIVSTEKPYTSTAKQTLMLWAANLKNLHRGEVALSPHLNKKEVN